ncbi:MAG: DNA-binding NtrC family response regulator [Paracoccaceae bacterium]|jgi:DNA-binding NtrC family response regulator
MRRPLEHLLGRSGWDIHAFSGVRAALAKLAEFAPDVILSDVRMPGMTGLELLAELNNEDAPPLVLISAHGDISMAVQAMQDGAYLFLEKPFDPRPLLRVLRHAAETHRLLSTTKRLRAQLSELSGIDRVFGHAAAAQQGLDGSNIRRLTIVSQMQAKVALNRHQRV